MGPDRWWQTLWPLPVAMHGHRLVHEARRRLQGPLLRQWAARCQRAGHVRAAHARPGALAALGRALADAPRLPDVAGELDFVGWRAPLPVVDWRLPGARPLQVYTAHALDWAEALAAGVARDRNGPHANWLSASLSAWCVQAPVLPKAWEPYVRARRILACLRAAARLPDHPLRPTLLAVAAAAAADLDLMLEGHLRGNHLLADWLGLAAAEAAFGGDGRAQRALLAEWDRQSAADGAHVECSAMYHAQLTEDLLAVAALGEPGGALAGRARRSIGWLAAVRHPDGQVPSFGDSDPDALAALVLTQSALRTATPTATDPTASAWTARGAGGHFVVVHTAPAACVEQPGHAHDDALALEWSYGGARVLADAGLGGYEGDPHRALNRSAASHSTVQVPGRPGLDLWGAFRVGARGEVRAVRAGMADGWQWVAGRFCWPDGRLGHRRLVALGPSGQLALADAVDGPDAAAAEAIGRLIAAPGVTLAPGSARLPDGHSVTLAATGALHVGEGVRFAQRSAVGLGPELRYPVGRRPIWLCLGSEPNDLDRARTVLEDVWAAGET
ncbi:MAG: heparinase II/III-family protein [Deltaproteobacteria bacterium]|nr:heparinase II/III-family protein [Deltaproteobacteria bacterium]